MVRILHTADIHLDSPLNSLAMRDRDLQERVRVATRESLKRIVDISIEKKVAALLICGDLFDNAERSVSTMVYLIKQMERLKDNDVQVFYIKGNHDAENPILGEVEFPSNVHLFTGNSSYVQLDSTNVCIHGVSFSSRLAPDSLIPKFKSPIPGMVNIALMHSSVSGAEGHDNYAPCSVNDMINTGFDYWALGHIHKRRIYSENPWIVMPGIPQGRDVGESGAKSATLINIDSGQISIEEIPTSIVEFSETELDITDCNDMDSLWAAIRRHLHQQHEQLHSPSGIIRVLMKGYSKMHWQIHRDQEIISEFIRDTARDIGGLGIDKIKIKLSTEDTSNSQDATSELTEIMERLQVEREFEPDFINEVNNVFGQLPNSVRKKLLDSEDAATKWVKQLSEGGRLRVVANMRTQSQ